ncbi:MAG: hypothetical protein HY859_13780 [Caulobacterales bacterium]|nr:hypothetical protein [Caulobacterales bacterium]
MGRLLIAGLVGGIAMFIWSALAHTVIPLGETGMQMVGPDSAVTAALQAELGDKAGLYGFPGVAGDPHRDEAAMAAMTEKMKTGASGLIVYHAPGYNPPMNTLMGRELALEIVQSLILAWLLTKLAVSGLGARTTAAALVGVAVALSTNGSYWNWWGFPADYTLAAMVIQVVGYTVAGLVIAFVLGWKRKAAEAS